METLIIAPEAREIFSEHNLKSFGDFMRTEIGEVLSDEMTRSTRRFELGGETFYLKRHRREKFRSALETALVGRRPHGVAYREMLNARNLRTAGIDVMDVVAAGERRICGVPRASFIVAKAVQGEELCDLHQRLSADDRVECARGLGKLCGRMHGNGFFSSLRLKDVICQNLNQGESLRFVLIDRETRDPHPKRFSRQRAAASLVKAERYLRKNDDGLTSAEVRAFIKGYQSEVKECWPVKPSELLRYLVDLGRA